MAELNGIIKKMRNIMRNDAGVSGDAQRIEQLTWLLFLKIYDAKEEEWEIMENDYVSIIPDKYKWRNWAVDNKDGQALTGTALLEFVDKELFPALLNLEIDVDTPVRQAIVKAAFDGVHNYMKDGTLLREVINTLNDIDFNNLKDRHAFGDIYETMLKEIQAMGKAGEYYTPRAVTDFIVEVTNPKIGERMADFACGTGGFLTSTLNHLKKQVSTTAEQTIYSNSVYGVDKMPLPYILCITNMILHDVDNPQVFHTNSLEKNVREYAHEEKFDIILMNPPYGGSEKEIIKSNFPSDLRSSETADLFMILIMYRLKKDGRAAVILPDGFLFGSDVKASIKRKLMTEFNLHTVIRMPNDVFAPYTNIRTNILFFSNDGPTKETWFYRMDMPDGYKHFSKTKPIKLEHFKPVLNWWNNRKEIILDDAPKSKLYSFEEIASNGFDLDLCGFPQESTEILPPDEVIRNYRKERAELTAKIDSILNEIESILDGEKSA